jgi:hypothetical protein
MHLKLSLKMNFLVRLVLVVLSFGRVVFWSSCLLVELVLVYLLWSSCRLVELSLIQTTHHHSGIQGGTKEGGRGVNPFLS